MAIISTSGKNYGPEIKDLREQLIATQQSIELAPMARIKELERVVESGRTQLATLFMTVSDLVEDSDKKLELLAQLKVILEGVENLKRESFHDQISALRLELSEQAVRVENLEKRAT